MPHRKQFRTYAEHCLRLAELIDAVPTPERALAIQGIRPKVMVAVRTSPLSCWKARKMRIFTPVRESSGESRFIPLEPMQLPPRMIPDDWAGHEGGVRCPVGTLPFARLPLLSSHRARREPTTPSSDGLGATARFGATPRTIGPGATTGPCWPGASRPTTLPGACSTTKSPGEIAASSGLVKQAGASSSEQGAERPAAAEQPAAAERSALGAALVGMGARTRLVLARASRRARKSWPRDGHAHCSGDGRLFFALTSGRGEAGAQNA